MRGRFALLASLLLSVAGASSAQDAVAGRVDVLPQITVVSSPAGDMLTVSASIVAIRAVEVTGEMVVSRKGAAGTVSSRQSRQIALPAGGAAIIAETSVSFAPGDDLDVLATIYKDGIVMSRATLSTSD